MNNFYDFDIIPTILEKFKISRIIFCGLSDENLIKEILKYDAHITEINTDTSENMENNVFNALSELENYDAIFIDDDPNWFTVYNELNIIEKANPEFPLVFICNNKFPHKFRDSYINPEVIPQEYIHEYSDNLPILYENEEFWISDGLYHAIKDKTPKNGVSTAIKDFLAKHNNIKIMEINFVEDITILYPASTISKIRIDKIFNQIKEDNIKNIKLSDKHLENQLLISYIAQHNFNNESQDEISIKHPLENKLDDIRDLEVEYKNSQIESFKNEINLKNAQIKKIEYTLVNNENEIESLQTELQNTTNQITKLKTKINTEEKNSKNEINSLQEKLQNSTNQEKYLRNSLKNKENDFFIRETNLTSQLDEHLEKINKQKKEIAIKNKQLEIKENELKDKEITLKYINSQYTHQISEIDNKKYCISCFKEEIGNKNLEIEYLKKRRLTRKLLSPLSYIYLILKSKPNEIKLNLKLFKALKNSKCFDVGFYLNNNKDVQNSVWDNYLSPELHYICHGFSENREFNKKYFNRNSKKELINYLIECGDL